MGDGQTLVLPGGMVGPQLEGRAQQLQGLLIVAEAGQAVAEHFLHSGPHQRLAL